MRLIPSILRCLRPELSICLAILTSTGLPPFRCLAQVPYELKSMDHPPSLKSQPLRKSVIARCNDKRDNDRDGLIDYPRDPDCRNRRDNSERPGTKATPTPSPAQKGIPGLGNNASLQGRRPFPDDNPWNQDISAEPVDPNSDALIASIGTDTGLHPDFGTVWEGAPIGIPYV